jgi:pimeloyl-ACP methyl ester carboxylesterase
MQQIRQLDAQRYVNRFTSIRIPVLFMNGELDEYTTARDIHQLSQYIRNASFVTVAGTGHFLDLENKRSWAAVRDQMVGFMLDQPKPQTEEALDASPFAAAFATS